MIYYIYDLLLISTFWLENLVVLWSICSLTLSTMETECEFVVGAETSTVIRLSFTQLRDSLVLTRSLINTQKGMKAFLSDDWNISARFCNSWHDLEIPSNQVQSDWSSGAKGFNHFRSGSLDHGAAYLYMYIWHFNNIFLCAYHSKLLTPFSINLLQ